MVRSGAANGLAEVLVAQGGESVQTLLPEILTNAGNRDAAIAKREGYLGLFIFLPATMRNDQKIIETKLVVKCLQHNPCP